MFERSEAIDQLAAALAKAQSTIEGAAKDKQNPHLRTRYADLGSVWDACKTSLVDNGLAVAQLPDACADEPVLRTVLTHVSGQWMASTIPLKFSDDEKGRSTMQALGSALTYARRYGLSAMTGVCPEDDDGATAGGTQQRRPEPARQPEPRQERAKEAPDDDYTWDQWVAKLIRRWARTTPIENQADQTSREQRITNALVSAAMAPKLLYVKGPEIWKPDQEGVNEAERVRDMTKTWAAAYRLWSERQEWARKTTLAYLQEKVEAAQAEAQQG